MTVPMPTVGSHGGSPRKLPPDLGREVREEIQPHVDAADQVGQPTALCSRARLPNKTRDSAALGTDRRIDSERTDAMSSPGSGRPVSSRVLARAPPTVSAATSCFGAAFPARTRGGSQGSPAGAWRHRRTHVAVRSRTAVTHDSAPGPADRVVYATDSDDVSEVRCDRCSHHVGRPPPGRRRSSEQWK